jgi:hypothetical protein
MPPSRYALRRFAPGKSPGLFDRQRRAAAAIMNHNLFISVPKQHHRLCLPPPLPVKPFKRSSR